MAIAIIIATAAMSIHVIRSAVVATFEDGGLCVGTGVGVAAAVPTETDAAPDELPYEPSPAKLAVMVYVSAFGGVHWKPKVP